MLLISILLNSILLSLQVQSSLTTTNSTSKSSPAGTTKHSKSSPAIVATPPTGFLCANKAYPLAHCGIVNQGGTIRSVPADIITMHNVTYYSCDEVFQEETLGAYCCQTQLRQGAKYCKAAVIRTLT